jgi:hypothetical protein
LEVEITELSASRQRLLEKVDTLSQAESKAAETAAQVGSLRERLSQAERQKEALERTTNSLRNANMDVSITLTENQRSCIPSHLLCLLHFSSFSIPLCLSVCLSVFLFSLYISPSLSNSSNSLSYSHLSPTPRDDP